MLSNERLQRPGALAGLSVERLEGSVSSSFDQTVRLASSAPAAETQSRYAHVFMWRGSATNE